MTTRSARRRGRAMAAARLLVAALAACSSTDDHPDEIGTQEQSLATQISSVTLRTVSQGRYLGAENGGGGRVLATATSAAGWESFQLVDTNGGTLQSGDVVYLRASNGQLVRALNGGGGGVDATGGLGQAWEAFRVTKANGG